MTIISMVSPSRILILSFICMQLGQSALVKTLNDLFNLIVLVSTILLGALVGGINKLPSTQNHQVRQSVPRSIRTPLSPRNRPHDPSVNVVPGGEWSRA